MTGGCRYIFRNINRASTVPAGCGTEVLVHLGSMIYVAESCVSGQGPSIWIRSAGWVRGRDDGRVECECRTGCVMRVSLMDHASSSAQQVIWLAHCSRMGRFKREIEVLGSMFADPVGLTGDVICRIG